MRSPSVISRQSNKKILLFAVFCFLTLRPVLFAQNTTDLENKKKKVEQNIKNTQEKLQKTKENKALTLKDYTNIQKKIDDRKEVITGVQTEIQYVNSIIGHKYAGIAKLKEQIQSLRHEYARIMKSAYKASLMTNEWMLILSSSSMNQAFHRWMYLRNIKKDRKAKAAAIVQKQLELETELANLENMKSGKQVLLKKEEGQSNLLLKDLNEKNKVLSNLSKDEKKLISDLNRQKKEQRAITAEIEKAIRREIARKEKEARELAERERKKEAERLAAEAAKSKKATGDVSSESTTSSTSEKSADTKPVSTAKKVTEKKALAITETPESASLSSDFQANRGSFSWPVRRGVIVRGFGKQVHPELSHVTIQNNGIDIKTDPDADVSAIFEGEIVQIVFLAGYKNTVMVNHGKYYTIYSNLESVRVNKGQKVKKGDILGHAAVNGDTGNTEVHFELWNKQSPLNPALWLKR